MKIEELIKERAKTDIIEWDDNLKIGWIAENKTITLYYGATKNEICDILREGILADKDGYVMCALEPFTALAQGKIRNRGDNVVVVCEITKKQQKEMISLLSEGITIVPGKKEVSEDLYESWAKSDVEFYALTEAYVPVRVSAECIKGFMVKKNG